MHIRIHQPSIEYLFTVYRHSYDIRGLSGGVISPRDQIRIVADLSGPLEVVGARL